jgi:integrase
LYAADLEKRADEVNDTAYELLDDIEAKWLKKHKPKKEMPFWTTEEYKKFSEAVIDKPVSFYAFEMLYWTGMRLGELLALTMED